MGLREQTVTGLAWSLTSQAGRQVIQLVITAILARLLDSTDFGLLGMATVFTGFLLQMNEKGFAGALIQNQKAGEAHYSTVFWMSLVLAFGWTALLALGSAPIAAFYGRPELQPIVVWLSLNFVIAATMVVPRALLIKAMDFKKLAGIETAATAFSGAAGIWAALSGYGYWSLVAQTIAFHLVSSILFLALCPWKPKAVFSVAAFREMFHFSAHSTLTFVFNYASRNADYLLIGKFLGAELLGYYTLAYKLMMAPLQNISWVFSKVMFPAFSRVQNDPVRLREGYLKMTKGISLITFPILCALIVVAPGMIDTVFGAKWRPAVDLVRILAVCGLFQSIATVLGNILLAQGKADVQLRFGIANTIVSVTAIGLGLQGGIIGVALFYTVSQLLWTPLAMRQVHRMIGLPDSVFWPPLLKSFAMSAGMAVCMGLAAAAVRLDVSYEWLIVTVLGALLYLALVFKFERRFFENPAG